MKVMAVLHSTQNLTVLSLKLEGIQVNKFSGKYYNNDGPGVHEHF